MERKQFPGSPPGPGPGKVQLPDAALSALRYPAWVSAALTNSFGLSAERCILAPGNHDVEDTMDAYMRRKDAQGLSQREWIQQGSINLARDPEKYPQRFKAFSNGLFHKVLQRPYPESCAEQGMSIPFFDTGIPFLVFNSCWEIDEFHRHRAGIHPEAVAHAIQQSLVQVKDAQASRQWAQDKPALRIAVWHHAVTAPDFKMSDLDFLGHLRKNGVALALHGDVHEMRRQQKKPDGDWDGWFEWTDPKGGRLAYRTLN